MCISLTGHCIWTKQLLISMSVMCLMLQTDMERLSQSRKLHWKNLALNFQIQKRRGQRQITVRSFLILPAGRCFWISVNGMDWNLMKNRLMADDSIWRNRIISAYTVEDTGAFARYGVQFDVYYDSHAAASAHGHQTWECYLADDNGSNEVEVTRTRDVDVLNVTLNSGNLMSICQDRLGFFQKELFSAYNDTKGNLQMFATPVDFNWYSSVTSYYGYRIHPISGANQLHNGMDIGAPEGTKVMAGLTGTVTTSAYNDSYGNYVVIKDSKGYELRYAHLSSRSVSAGASVTKGDEIGLVGNTGNSTGSHLHIELLKNGERLNPIFYLETGEGAGFGGNEYTSEAAQRLLNEAARYLGTPYVWGGYSTSGFDCSGFVSYCLTHSGVRNTGRLTAQGLYDICTPVSQSEAQPGDLIFFTGTYDAGVPVTHIGIYVGNGQMIHCGHPVQYTSINSPYWQSHFYGFGRW